MLAAIRRGDTLVVPKLDRLARSVPDARAIGDSLAAGGVRLSIGGTVYDPSDPLGKMFFNILATFAEFEVDLLRMRTREGMAVARANGLLKGKAPKLSARQRAHRRTIPLCVRPGTGRPTAAADQSPRMATDEERRLPGLLGRADEHFVDGHPPIAAHDVSDRLSDVLREQGLDRPNLALSRLPDVLADM